MLRSSAFALLAWSAFKAADAECSNHQAVGAGECTESTSDPSSMLMTGNVLIGSITHDEEVEDGLSKLAQVSSRGDVNPEELLHCDDCIMKFNSSGGCDLWRNHKEAGNSCLDYLSDSCTRKAVTFCAIATDTKDEGKSTALLEQREVRDDRTVVASLAVRSTGSLGSKAGAKAGASIKKELLAEVLGESLTNGITAGLAQIPGIHEYPIIGDFLGLGPTQDMTNNVMHEKLHKQIGDGFADIKGELDIMGGQLDTLGTQVGNLKTQVDDQTTAINGMIQTSTSTIIRTITANAQENLRAIHNFRQQAQRNHDAAMSKAREDMFDSHHRQCLEYTTSIMAKYGLYELVLSSALDKRQRLIDGLSSQWTTHELKYCNSFVGGNSPTKYWNEEEAKTACLADSTCYGIYVNGWQFYMNLCSTPPNLLTSSASWVIEKGPVSKNEVMLAVQESKQLFHFLSGTGMGTVIDFQHLYTCVMPTPYTESLLSKFIRLQTSSGTWVDTSFSSQARKASLELASDILDTGKMSFDMQDMQLLVVDRLDALSRAKFAIQVGTQLTTAFQEFRTTIHTAQTDLSFLDFSQWPNNIIIEYGYGDATLCPGGFDKQGGTYSGDSEQFNVGRSIFERLCQETIDACVNSDTCNEALVWANVWTGEYGDTFDVSWYTQLATTPKGYGCKPGSAMNVRSGNQDAQYHNGAFAAFLILQE